MSTRDPWSQVLGRDADWRVDPPVEFRDYQEQEAARRAGPSILDLINRPAPVLSAEQEAARSALDALASALEAERGRSVLYTHSGGVRVAFEHFGAAALVWVESQAALDRLDDLRPVVVAAERADLVEQVDATRALVLAFMESVRVAPRERRRAAPAGV